VINKYNIFKKTIEKIFEGIYFNPVMAEDENTIYFLKYNTSDYFDPGSDIVRYDLTNKKFEKLNFSSIQKLWIYDDYTVSPNGKIVVFQNCHQEDSALYVIDLENLKVIDRVPVSNGDLLSNYSWKPDSSFCIFTSDSKVFYKYTIPKY
jgi:Tol biopolymer transport system component